MGRGRDPTIDGRRTLILLFLICGGICKRWNFGSNSLVWHESFSTASRVGIVAMMEGWVGAECAILGMEIGGDRAGGSHGWWSVGYLFLSTDFCDDDEWGTISTWVPYQVSPASRGRPRLAGLRPAGRRVPRGTLSVPHKKIFTFHSQFACNAIQSFTWYTKS